MEIISLVYGWTYYKKKKGCYENREEKKIIYIVCFIDMKKSKVLWNMIFFFCMWAGLPCCLYIKICLYESIYLDILKCFEHLLQSINVDEMFVWYWKIVVVIVIVIVIIIIIVVVVVVGVYIKRKSRRRYKIKRGSRGRRFG